VSQPPLIAASYCGRFAPSPTGPLHAGSLVAALASWLDARAHGGRWLLRIEDLDPPRAMPGAGAGAVQTLARLGLEPDAPVLWQSGRHERYAAALARLQSASRVYGCSCSRSDIAAATQPGGGASNVYPGTCRTGALGAVRALRLRIEEDEVSFVDRWHGRIVQDVAGEVGDFLIRRADGLWAYQLAVVVDDAEQGVTDVVRGADLIDNTPRQIVLQRALGLPTPRYLHVPVVTNAQGKKLSKQTGAPALDAEAPLAALERAWRHLGFERLGADNLAAFHQHAVEQWRARWAVAPDA
jgi:glutamyl-Q tRNA(Asp) synthetase